MIRISPDFMHLCKRLRYRLLSNLVHMNFGEKSVFVDIQQIRSILKHVPEISFFNDKMTKIHYSLPLSLFSLHENKITKKNLIGHLNSIFLVYQEYYFNAINYF